MCFDYATSETKSLMHQYGKSWVNLGGHSRGSMTIGNALESIASSLKDDKEPLSQTTVTFFGPAYNANKADSILSKLQGRDFKDSSVRDDFVLQLHTHYLDPVATQTGKNPSTGGTMPIGNNEFVERLKVMFGDNTAHNCYGNAGIACGGYWDGKVSLPVKVNILKKE